MSTLAPSHLPDIDERKALGRAHLESGRVEAALQVYARILRDYPNDIDAYLFLGDCYLADGDGETALLLYGQAAERDPAHTEIQRRIELAAAEEGPALAPRRVNPVSGDRSFGEAIPTNAQAVARLMQRLIGQQPPVSENEVLKASELLHTIIHSSRPAQTVAESLDQIDALLPALLELNIRQARADGRPDLAQGLQYLLDNILLQMRSQPAKCAPVVASTAARRTARTRPPADLRVLFLRPSAAGQAADGNLAADALAHLGCQVDSAPALPTTVANQYDVVVANRPHSDQTIMEGLAACAAAQVPIILDLDIDVEHMPLDHPDYEAHGLGTPARARAYTAALLLANVIRVPGEAFAASLQGTGKRVAFIPEGWNRNNDLWYKPTSLRHTLNLGWVGSPGGPDDLLEIRRILVRVLREFPHVQMVIGGDPQAYKLFDHLPDGRCLFLPAASPEDYPYLLGQIDLLAVPLRNTPFYRAVSDRRLMEAGVRGIPWVASPVPAFIDWNAGGLVAYSLEEWHTYLRQLVLDSDLRTCLGQAGRQQADDREMKVLGKAWLGLIESVLSEKTVTYVS